MSHPMPGMAPGHEVHEMTGFLGSYPMSREASGTSWQPDSSPMEGIHWMRGAWMGMVHGFADVVYDPWIDQTPLRIYTAGQLARDRQAAPGYLSRHRRARLAGAFSILPRCCGLRPTTLVDLASDAPFSIAVTAPTTRPRRTLKCGDCFAVFDSHGDIGATAGGHDGLFWCDTRFLSRLERIPGVARTRTTIVLSTPFERGGLPVEALA